MNGSEKNSKRNGREYGEKTSSKRKASQKFTSIVPTVFFGNNIRLKKVKEGKTRTKYWWNMTAIPIEILVVGKETRRRRGEKGRKCIP